MGKPKDPDYWKKYRARNAAYRKADNARRTERKRLNGRGDRSKEYASRPSRAVPQVPVLYPELRSGVAVSFWEDELRMDVAQERALAALEGRDPDSAAKQYRSRETNWRGHTVPFIAATFGEQEEAA